MGAPFRFCVVSFYKLHLSEISANHHYILITCTEKTIYMAYLYGDARGISGSFEPSKLARDMQFYNHLPRHPGSTFS